jgi:putative ABC transport system permease protein
MPGWAWCLCVGDLSAVPGVIAVGAVSDSPLDPIFGHSGVAEIDSSPPQNSERRTPIQAERRAVTTDYFRAIGLPLLRGRGFAESDQRVSEQASPNLPQPAPPSRVVISERLAKLFFPNEDPIGKHVRLGRHHLDAGVISEVIGVVGDSRERGLDSDPTLAVYLPYSRTNFVIREFVVHTRANPLALAPVLQRIVAELDPKLAIANFRSFDELISRSVAPRRFNTILLGVFSGLALLLATTGIYGVLSYSMSRRTSEIGLRMALGATTNSILRLTILQGMRPALLGIGLGVIGAWWLSSYLTALLFGIKPFDTITYAAVAALLLVTALFACYLPGRRAMRIDPAVALRTE